jgi:hypothetical protein
MYKWAVRRQIRRNITALAEGDIAPLLRGYARDAVLVFPGESSWEASTGGTPRWRPSSDVSSRPDCRVMPKTSW